MMRLYARITKIDEARKLVFGYASTEAEDSQGEVVKREALEAALPDYMRFANIREMHQPSAVGVATEAEMDEKGLFLAAHIVDPLAWEKIVQGVYKGFSIGGRVTRRDEAQKHVITGVKLSEISLVDRPANPEAVFTMFKADEDALGKQGARNSKADLARIQEIHDHAAALGAACSGDAEADDGAAGKAEAGGTLAKALAELADARERIARLEAAAGGSDRPPERKAALRAVAIDKAADGPAGGREPDTTDPVELMKRTLRRPMSLADIEKRANG